MWMKSGPWRKTGLRFKKTKMLKRHSRRWIQSIYLDSETALSEITLKGNNFSSGRAI